MAATRIVEEERGTITGAPRNPHQGYYAGDFTNRPTVDDGFARGLRYAEPTVSVVPTSRWL